MHWCMRHVWIQYLDKAFIKLIEAGTNGPNFADDIFICFFLNETCCILVQISLKFVPIGPIINKLGSYNRRIIDEHTFHTQLDMIQILSHRIAFVRLVTSSHRLKVETGRWTRPVTPVEERLCDQCKKIDDEYHFLLECSKFSVLRKRFIPRYYYIRPSMFKYVQLINSMNCKTVRQLGKYIYHAFSQYV